MAAYGLARRETPWQMDLFEDVAAQRLDASIDALIDRFGSGVVGRASDLRGHGTIADEPGGGLRKSSTNGVNLDFMDAVLADAEEAPGGG